VAPQAKADDAADAVRETLSGISSIEGRAAQTTNIVLGGDTSLQTWRELDEKFNEYPTERTFKAIGSGGEDFVSSMISVVESAVGTVTPGRVAQRPSSKGKYVAVTIGPIMMQNADQVIQIYSGMREDERLRWYL
jgi:putative lipoic acid-binding regulatory protein